MAKRISLSTLNASSIDIINTIRQNATAEYQSLVPEIESTKDIPKVGEVLYGYPALANQFITSLVNRIASVRVKSATFNNAYAELKKGYLEFGETVEEVFVNITKAREFNVEKAESRELKRTLPDVRTAFHAMNYRVQYPVTIQDEDLRLAFLSAEGVTDLIAKIVGAVSVAAEYDEFLLFKYLIIKAISHGKMYPVSVGATMETTAEAFRGMSNKLGFMKTEYNISGVHTVTPKSDQCIFMDSDFNAKFDVEVLAGAFNMDKADFMGKLYLIDDFTTFDNERFSVIVDNSDFMEEVTSEELTLMGNVKAVLLDKEWFQIYDNQSKFTEKYVASGEYWNYFYNVWKTVSSSPFSNAIVFVDNSATISLPDSITVEIVSKEVSEDSIIYTFNIDDSTPSLSPSSVEFVQTADATEDFVAVHKYGAVILPNDSETTYTLKLAIGDTTYTASNPITGNDAVGDTITCAKDA